MSQEISISATVKAAKGGFALPTVERTATLDMAGTGLGSIVQNISHTADGALAIPGSVTGAYWLEVWNEDSTNFISLSTGTGGSFAGAVFTTVPPQSSIVIRAPGTIYAKADTADVAIQFKACQV